MNGSWRTLGLEPTDLREAIRCFETMLAPLRNADVRVQPAISLCGEEALAKLRKGVPLLHDLDLEIDPDAFRELMISIVRAIEEVLPVGCSPQGSDSSPRAAARQVRLALHNHLIDVESVLSYAAAGHRGLIAPVARALRIDTDMLWTVAQNALKPALRAWCRQLAPLAAEVEWLKGACYVCGATATLGELRGGTGAKHLRCGQCGADWQHHRLRCMYCGNEDHRTLGYLMSREWESTTRVDVCELCKGYLKVITAFAPAPPELLLFQDLATVMLDYAAQEQGYVRGTVRL